MTTTITLMIQLKKMMVNNHGIVLPYIACTSIIKMSVAIPPQIISISCLRNKPFQSLPDFPQHCNNFFNVESGEKFATSTGRAYLESPRSTAMQKMWINITTKMHLVS